MGTVVPIDKITQIIDLFYVDSKIMIWNKKSVLEIVL